LTKEQRDQLLGIGMGVIMVIGALWYFLVMSKQDELVVTRRKSAEMAQKLRDAETLMRRQGEIDSTLQSRSEMLTQREAGLAPDRDTYAWLINTVNNFISGRKNVNIDTYSQPEIGDAGLVPRFPYKWATFHLKGTGYYQDLGKFFADFENAFPYFQIQNPVFTANAGTGMEPEKLSVSFDLVAPVTASETK
jgi:Tfp pilus assembly protein PilO